MGWRELGRVGRSGLDGTGGRLAAHEEELGLISSFDFMGARQGKPHWNFAVCAALFIMW